LEARYDQSKLGLFSYFYSTKVKPISYRSYLDLNFPASWIFDRRAESYASLIANAVPFFLINEGGHTPVLTRLMWPNGGITSVVTARILDKSGFKL